MTNKKCRTITKIKKLQKPKIMNWNKKKMFLSK